MRIILVIIAVLVGLAPTVVGGEGMVVPGATTEAILSDCAITGDLAVQLMQMKAKTTPVKMYEFFMKMLKEQGYKGSFGNVDYLAGFYTGLALQSGPDVDLFMSNISAKDLALMKEEHEVMCIKSAFSETEGK